jgi:hypothetical protein
VWINRFVRNQPKPWTDDPILQQFRFCNVYRELDTVTQWIKINWREPHATDPDMWFAMVVARLFNWPPTLAHIGYPVPWRPATALRHVKELQARPNTKVFSSAYIVSTNGHTQDKAEYLCEHVLAPLWGSRKGVRPRPGEPLAEVHERLMQFNGLGSFMAAQVVCDVKHAPTGPLGDAPTIAGRPAARAAGGALTGCAAMILTKAGTRAGGCARYKVCVRK